MKNEYVYVVLSLVVYLFCGCSAKVSRQRYSVVGIVSLDEKTRVRPIFIIEDNRFLPVCCYSNNNIQNRNMISGFGPNTTPTCYIYTKSEMIAEQLTFNLDCAGNSDWTVYNRRQVDVSEDDIFVLTENPENVVRKKTGGIVSCDLRESTSVLLNAQSEDGILKKIREAHLENIKEELNSIIGDEDSSIFNLKNVLIIQALQLPDGGKLYSARLNGKTYPFDGPVAKPWSTRWYLMKDGKLSNWILSGVPSKDRNRENIVKSEYIFTIETGKGMSRNLYFYYYSLNEEGVVVVDENGGLLASCSWSDH